MNETTLRAPPNYSNQSHLLNSILQAKVPLKYKLKPLTFSVIAALVYWEAWNRWN